MNKTKYKEMQGNILHSTALSLKPLHCNNYDNPHVVYSERMVETDEYKINHNSLRYWRPLPTYSLYTMKLTG